jgi:DNA repair exonuclease SbcCD ATPase subunit
MIKKIELWDFECHEHSVLEDFDSGLNLIFGESDSGKTSIVRALRLVAYNDFNPACVRLGAKNCQVRVETEKGWVHVTRGKDNIWRTCRTGETEQEFTKIGKNILPEASKILGLKIVELGDMSLPVNIMDQNEGHFMLNELGGNNASGSMRAQIVDEISGLSGIEGLIKEVSLDRHRFGRTVKENEDRAKELMATMHDQSVLDAEKKILDEVDELMTVKKNNSTTIEQMADLFEEHHGGTS